jgi:ferredoxin
MLVIDPEECIDCGLCIPECPADAIYVDDELPEDQKQFIEINERLSQKWPVITTMKDSPDDANEWDGVSGKLDYLDEG